MPEDFATARIGIKIERWSRVPVNVLLIAAHPDDADFVCGGTVAQLVRQGSAVSYVVVTSGELGSGGESRTREVEQRLAAAVLGVRSTTFLGFPDGSLQPTLGLRAALMGCIRRHEPELLVTHSPNRNYGSIRFSHPDHLAVGEATLAAVYPDARNPLAHLDHPAYELPVHVVPEVWLFGDSNSDHVVDISDTFDTKLEAIRAHASQLAGFEPTPDEFFASWAREIATEHDLPGALAEHFTRLDTR